MTDPPGTPPGSPRDPETTINQADADGVAPPGTPSSVASSIASTHTLDTVAEDEQAPEDVDDVWAQSSPRSLTDSAVSDESLQARLRDLRIHRSLKPAPESEASSSHVKAASTEIPSPPKEEPSVDEGKMAVTRGELRGVLLDWSIKRTRVPLHQVFDRAWADDLDEPDSVEQAVLIELRSLPEPPTVADIDSILPSIRRKVYNGGIKQGLDDVGTFATDFLVLAHLWHYFHREKKVTDFPWMEHKPDMMAGGSDDGFRAHRKHLALDKTIAKPREAMPTTAAPTKAASTVPETKQSTASQAAPPPAKLGKIPLQGYNQRPQAPPQAPAKPAQGSKYPEPNASDHPFSTMIRRSTSLREQAWNRYKGGPEHYPSELPFEVCFKDKVAARQFFFPSRIVDDVNKTIGGRVKFLTQWRGSFSCLVLSPDPKLRLDDVYQTMVCAWELAMECKKQGERQTASGAGKPRYPDLSGYFKSNWEAKWRKTKVVHDNRNPRARFQATEKAKSEQIDKLKNMVRFALAEAQRSDRGRLMSSFMENMPAKMGLGEEIPLFSRAEAIDIISGQWLDRKTPDDVEDAQAWLAQQKEALAKAAAEAEAKRKAAEAEAKKQAAEAPKGKGLENSRWAQGAPQAPSKSSAGPSKSKGLENSRWAQGAPQAPSKTSAGPSKPVAKQVSDKRKATAPQPNASQADTSDRRVQGFPPPMHPRREAWEGFATTGEQSGGFMPQPPMHPAYGAAPMGSPMTGQHLGGFTPQPPMYPAYGAAPMGPPMPWPNVPGQAGYPPGNQQYPQANAGPQVYDHGYGHGYGMPPQWHMQPR
ncbi:hypothetical protein LX32DRAFT_726264 [Colletotrichum zoysiae]|uniref:Uncharacterized protein n=1 Tax=Colletotrichum zoysiae TaxID=1216348 RepID=A0AAD9M2L0_9PEZI|nr:hypothetical protein LX32DRAFT_726264 [Colletotrichum zoysiae]